jgi:hypothetical protein
VSGHNRYLDDQGDVEVDETMAVRIDSLLSVVKVEKHDTMHLSDDPFSVPCTCIY